MNRGDVYLVDFEPSVGTEIRRETDHPSTSDFQPKSSKSWMVSHRSRLGNYRTLSDISCRPSYDNELSQ